MKKTYLDEYIDSKPVIGKKLEAVLLRLRAEKANDARFIYDTKKAHFYIDFIEKFVKGAKAPYYGKPTKLLLWQKAFIEVFYSFKWADTKRDRFTRALLVIARKNGKSTLASSLGFCEFILGAGGNDIVCSSNDDRQASILYDSMETVRAQFDPHNKRTKKTISWILNKTNSSRISRLNQTSKSKDGFNIDFAIIDELHEMRDNSILKAIEQSQSVKENPKLLMITTNGFVNGGVLDELLDYSDKVIAGEVEDASFLPWLYMQDSEKEIWDDKESWAKSNPSLKAIKKVSYLEQQILQAQVSKTERTFIVCKDFNIKQNSSESWLLPQDYQYPQKALEYGDLKGLVAVAGVDLSMTTDLTALNILITQPDDQNKYVLSHYFLPEGKLTKYPDSRAGAKYNEWIRDGYITVCKGNDIDIREVAEWLIMLCRDYGLKLFKVGYDQRFAKSFVDILEDCGIETEVVYQNPNTISAPMRSLEADFKAHNVQYGNNPVTEWCLGNVCAYTNSLGQTMAIKIAGELDRRIDGAIALIIAYAVYNRERGEYNIYNKENKI